MNNNSTYQNVYTHLERMVAMPTVSGEEIPADEIIMYASAVLESADMHVRTYKNEGFPSLVATSQPGSKKPKLFLLAHLDVVAAKQDQFILRRRSGRLYGRGVIDMKYAAACFLETALSLKDEMAKYDFGIMLTTDEETDGAHGTGFLMEEGYRCEVGLLPDCANNWQVEAMAKGAWRVQATATGKTAHASRPWEAESASDKLLGFLQDARTAIPSPDKHTDTTLVISLLQAGKAYNQVPDFASAGLDIRFLGNSTLTELEKELTAIARTHSVELESLVRIQPVELDLELPQLKEWEGVVGKVRGKISNEYALSFGASDARYLAAHGIPSIITSPEGAGLHSDDEWISEEGLYQFYECTLAYVKTIAGIK
mgnify:CR=1 FL=1